MPDLSGRVTLVTGGSRGIGRAISLELARAGARVAVNYAARPDAADEVVGLIREAGGDAVALKGDVADPEQAAGAGRADARRRSATTSGTSSATPASRATT